MPVWTILKWKRFMPRQKDCFKKILVVRTDRIGDVLLSTPVFKALRDNFPEGRIAVMVSPHTREVVEGNPYIDEVIIYDKDKQHKGFIGFWKFVYALRKKKFDLAIVLHTKKRNNLIAFLAGIPRRIGYNEEGKYSFLLTDKIRDTRMLGFKHEVDYCLDVLRELNLEIKDRGLYMPVKKEMEGWADGFLSELGVSQTEKLAAINPGASCPSKRWMPERFVLLINNLVEQHYFKIIIIAGKKDIGLARTIENATRYPVINIAGKTTISQLAALLKRCVILISNDSGPVHIASAVGTPVISIFGRNQAGLSPTRWGPTGQYDKYIHKEVGCKVCLAHRCRIGFDCLRAITVNDVLAAVEEVLGGR